MENLTKLTKESDENEIKLYFEKVLELKRSGKEFPINLEEVWPLVYSEKGKAVRALNSEYIENEDFICLPKSASGENEEVAKGGQNKIDYQLSIPCMEYFIARKVRPVFEVYRRVFHKAMEQKMFPKDYIAALEAFVESEKQKLLLAEKNEELEIALNESLQFYTVAKYNKVFKMKWSMKECQSIGKRLSAYCRARNIEVRKCQTNDERFGETNSYPLIVFTEFFGALKEAS